MVEKPEERLVKSFQKEIGNFLLEKLSSNWHSVCELSRQWYWYQNLREAKYKIKTYKIKSNPRISELIKLWFKNGFLVKDRITKKFERTRNNKVHVYISVCERYSLNLPKLFVFLLKYFVKKFYESLEENYLMLRQKTENSVFDIRKLEKTHEHENIKKTVESELKKVEQLEEQFKVLLENQSVREKLLHRWKFETVFKKTILDLVEQFVTTWVETRILHDQLKFETTDPLALWFLNNKPPSVFVSYYFHTRLLQYHIE